MTSKDKCIAFFKGPVWNLDLSGGLLCAGKRSKGSEGNWEMKMWLKKSMKERRDSLGDGVYLRTRRWTAGTHPGRRGRRMLTNAYANKVCGASVSRFLEERTADDFLKVYFWHKETRIRQFPFYLKEAKNAAGSPGPRNLVPLHLLKPLLFLT